jgi:acyl-CoA synthetase (AMP-forming)/AMP-acid ligase II
MRNKYNCSDFARKLPTIVDILRWRACNQADRLAFTYLVNGETESRSLTYGDLYQLAQTIGAWLQKRKMEKERVIILYPSGLEYIAVLMGCFYAGAVAVPLYPLKLNIIIIY